MILFANSRLGELSDTIGSLRYTSYEDGLEEMRKKYPSLADGGMHDASSSDSDGGDSIASSISGEQGETSAGGSNHPGRARGTSSSNDDTKKQIMLRDRLRISRPLFSKADFLGEVRLFLSTNFFVMRAFFLTVDSRLHLIRISPCSAQWTKLMPMLQLELS